MIIECPYLQRFHNIFCFLTININGVFGAPDYLLSKWDSIIGDIIPVIPENIDRFDTNDWEFYKIKWDMYYPPYIFTEKLRAIFLLTSICTSYSSIELQLKEFQRFGINFREVRSIKTTEVQVKIIDYANKLIFEDCKDLITGYVRELKMEDTLND